MYSQARHHSTQITPQINSTFRKMLTIKFKSSMFHIQLHITCCKQHRRHSDKETRILFPLLYSSIPTLSLHCLSPTRHHTQYKSHLVVGFIRLPTGQLNAFAKVSSG